VAWLAGLTDWPAVPGFAIMEVIQGCRNKTEVRAVEALVRPFAVVWPTPGECERARQAFTTYSLSHSLGLLDSLIGACALGRGATLLTFNSKHYRMIAGLVTEQPYAR
jgi:predicted nucleic acid-binding protein